MDDLGIAFDPDIGASQGGLSGRGILAVQDGVIRYLDIMTQLRVEIEACVPRFGGLARISIE
jgi:hypothetical protein